MSAEGGQSSGPAPRVKLPAEHECQTPSRCEGTMALPQALGKTLEMFTIALATFLLFTCSQLHSDLHSYAVSQTCGQAENGNQPRVQMTKWLFFFLNFHVLHIEERSCKSHWQMPYSAFTFFFLFFFSFFPPPVGSCFSCASQLVFFTLGDELGFI